MRIRMFWLWAGLAVCMAFAGGCAGNRESGNGEPGKGEAAAQTQEAEGFTRLWIGEGREGRLCQTPFVREGWVYMQTVADSGQVTLRKRNLMTGKDAWAVELEAAEAMTGVVSTGKVVIDSTGVGGKTLVGRSDATGAVLWSVALKGWGQGAGCLIDGLYIAVTTEGKVYAVESASGKVRWQVNVGGPIRSTPVGRGKGVLVVCTDGRLYELDLAWGGVKWSMKLGEGVVGDPVVAGKYLFVGVYQNAPIVAKMASVDLNKKEVVAKHVDWTEGVIARAEDDERVTVFVTGPQGLMAVAAHNQHLLWEYPMGWSRYARAVLMGDQLVMAFKKEDDDAAADEVVGVSVRGGGLEARRKGGAIMVYEEGKVMIGQGGDVVVLDGLEGVEAWKIGKMKLEIWSLGRAGAYGQRWSDWYGSMRGRVKLVRREVVDRTMLLKLRLVFDARERSMPVWVAFASGWVTWRVVDEEGRTVDYVDLGGSGSKVTAPRTDVFVPRDSLVEFEVPEESLSVPLDKAAKATGMGGRRFDPLAGKAYYLQVTMGTRGGNRDDHEANVFTGRMEFPLVRIPLGLEELSKEEAVRRIAFDGPLLFSPESDERIDAIGRMSLIDDPGVIEWYVKALGSADPFVIYSAIDGLCRRQEPEAFDGLMKALSVVPPGDPRLGEQIRLHTIGAMGFSPDPRARKMLLEFLKDRSGEVRSVALNAFYAGRRPEAEGLAKGMLQDADEEVRLTARVVLDSLAYDQETGR